MGSLLKQANLEGMKSDMTLLEYVISKSDELELAQSKAEQYQQSLQNILIDEFCPMYFNILRKTVYYAPYKARRGDKENCTYNDGHVNKKCTECWNRKVLSDDDSV